MSFHNVLSDTEMFVNNEVIRRSSLNKFEQWHQKYKQGLRMSAEIDGQNNIPSESDNQLSIQEQQIVNEYGAELQKILQPGLNILNRLNDGPLKNLKTQVESEVLERESLRKEHTSKIDQDIQQRESKFKVGEGELNRNMELKATELKTLLTQFQNKKRQHNREHLNNRINPILGWTLLIVLAILEAPLNANVFQFFKLGRVETYLTAGIVIIVFPVLSHFTGLALHKGSSGKPKFKSASLLIGVVLLFCFGLNWFRVEFLDKQ